MRGLVFGGIPQPARAPRTGRAATEGTDIYEMFTAALLAPLEEDKRLLLAVMSQADEFTAEMARAVTGAGRRAGAAA